MKYLLLTFTIILTFIIILTNSTNAYCQTEFYLNHKSYSNVNSPQYHPQPIHELIGIVKNTWKFDGIELSMDALINEGGSNGKQFTAFIKQLAVDLDSLEISRLWTANRITKSLKETFKLHLQIDMASQLVVDLDDKFRIDAVKEVLHRLPIDSYSIVISDYWNTLNVRNIITEDYQLKWENVMLEVPQLHKNYTFSEYWQEFGWHNFLLNMQTNDFSTPFNQIVNDVIIDRATTRAHYLNLVRFNINVGDDWTDMRMRRDWQVYARVLKRIEGLPVIISIQASRPLKWTVREDNKVGYGSEGFKNSITHIRKLLDKVDKDKVN